MFPLQRSTVQTLDRGLQILNLLAANDVGLNVAELAAALELDRAIVYRLVRTLELQFYALRRPDGQILVLSAAISNSGIDLRPAQREEPC